MFGYILAILAQLSWALGAIILKKQLQQHAGLPLTSFSSTISGAFSLALFILLLTISGIFSLPIFSIFRHQAKVLLSPENLPWVIVYSFFFVFLGEVLLIMGYMKGKSLIVLSLSVFFYPLFVSLFSVFLLKESITIKLVFGAILMAVGYILLLI